MDEREQIQDTVEEMTEAAGICEDKEETAVSSFAVQSVVPTPGQDEDEPVGSAESDGRKTTAVLNMLLSWVDDLVFYFAVFMLIMSFLLRPVVVDGQSMMNTLNHKDVLLLTAFLYTPDYGDIVVISPEGNESNPIIKRVIGISGDVITVDYETYTVYRNGEALTEEYARIDPQHGFGEDLDQLTYPYTVPEDCVFVLGDNRGKSSDSRQLGSLECGQILGKVVFRLYHDTQKYGGSVFGFVD